MSSPQQHKLDPGDEVFDPATLKSAGNIVSIDEEHGKLWLKRGPKLEDVLMPTSLIPGGAFDTRLQQASLRRLGQSILDATHRYPADEAILRRDVPTGSPFVQDDLEAAKDAVERLDSSYLVIQGPPGSGKTYTAARLICRLISRGRRVGVTALSHKAKRWYHRRPPPGPRRSQGRQAGRLTRSG